MYFRSRIAYRYCTGVPPLHKVQASKKEMKRSKTAQVQVTCPLELKQYCIPLMMPDQLSQLALTATGALLAIGGPSAGPSLNPLGAVAQAQAPMRLVHIPLDAAAFQVDGACFTGRVQIGWMSQLLEMPFQFVLHGDGKHKLHHGEWILLTIGTHYLRWDAHHLKLSTSFAPLMYLMCKQHESAGACLLLCHALNAVTLKYFGQVLVPGATMADHSDGFKIGFTTVFPHTPFGQCWPHIFRKWNEGEYCKKTWAHFEEVGPHLQAIHFASSEGQRDVVIRAVGAEWDRWNRGKEMKTFWNSYCVAPWDNWSVGLFDCRLCTPSQQTQETWHKQLLLTKIPAMFRGSTAFVFAETLPQLIEMDGLQIPSKLCFEVPAVPKDMMEKALWYVNHQTSHIHAVKVMEGEIVYYFLRKDNDAADRISVTLIKAYEETMAGKWPKKAVDLEGLLDLTQCLHCVEDSDDKWGYIPCEYNPMKLVCSCKGCKGYGICSHIIAVNHIVMSINLRKELHVMGQSHGSKKGGGNGMRPVPALTRVAQREPDSSDEEEERLLALGAQGK